MSKLATVRTALQGNASIQIVAVEESTHFPRPSGHWTHLINFIIAPSEGIYASAELQSFMESLIPGLSPTCVDKFREWDTSMEFGKLYFDETVGHGIIRHEITVDEPDFLPNSVVNNGKATSEETCDLRRRTCVRLYPNREIAMAHSTFLHSISRKDLGAFQARSRKLKFFSRKRIRA